MQKHKFFSVVLPLFCILITSVNFLWHLYGYRQDIFAKFDHAYWEKRYLESQWVVPNSKNSVGDDGLYAYVGYAYMQGKDPTLLNAELPPFGKYLVGLFEIATGTMGAFSLFFAGVLLVLIFLFTKSAFKSSLIASVTMMIFSLEPIFYEQMRAPYLDTLYFSAFLMTALFFINKKYLLSGIMLGLFMSIKSPFLGGLVLFVYVASLAISQEKFFKNTIIIGGSAFLTYLLTYARIFFLGHNLIYFLQVQKYIIHFYSTGAKGVTGAVIPMLLQGKWLTWFGPTVVVNEWTISWTLGFIGAFIGTVLLLRTRHKTFQMWFQVLWVVGYLAFLVMTPIFPRYLLLLLPFMYNLSIWAFLKSISLKYSWVLPS